MKWKEEGRSISTEPASYPEATFTGERRPELLVTKEDLKDALDDENTILLNSLSEADFNGETDTYARSGHIPGSVNVFFGNLSDPETKELYNDEQLRDAFEKVGALDPGKKVITYVEAASPPLGTLCF